MNKYRTFLAVLIIIIVVGLWFYLKQQSESPLGDNVFGPPEPVTLPEEAGADGKRPEIKYPVPEIRVLTEPAVPEGETGELRSLPPLDKSDEAMQFELENLFGKETVAELFLIKAVIRHFVVTVDNMTGRKLPQQYVFTTPPPDRFAVDKKSEDEIYLSADNYRRYERFVNLIDNLDVDRVTVVYRNYYSLFQEAYEDLGYPDQYFNDRFIEVIDHLIETPEANEPIRLIRPKVFYQFADPELESLSAGQKIMIRMGPENSARVKAVLHELRARLAGFVGKKEQ